MTIPNRPADYTTVLQKPGDDSIGGLSIVEIWREPKAYIVRREYLDGRIVWQEQQLEKLDK